MDEAATPVGVYILNYNGRPLLAECLPSVLRAASLAHPPCPVTVIDNDSSDDSIRWLAETHPQVRVMQQPNRGLCSFNEVLRDEAVAVAVLLNNDVKLAAESIDPLVAPLLTPRDSDQPPSFMTAPFCWLFDGQTYEGFRTAVGWRWGLVQSTALFPGHEQSCHVGGPTAAAGAALAVDRHRFNELGGFDPLYLPGRLEDLDFAYRGFQAGYQAIYVPESIAWHRGETTFAAAFGSCGSRLLALRNTLLFQWKNLRHPLHLLRQCIALPLRVAYDLARAPFGEPPARFIFCRALVGAIFRAGDAFRSKHKVPTSLTREAEFFRTFAPHRMASAAAKAGNRSEEMRAAGYPLSRWYLRPMAGGFAAALSTTAVRPWHLTLAGLLAAAVAAGLLLTGASYMPVAAALVLLAWFFDRADGQLARRQKTASPHGAWLDANVDELVDLGLHLCVAFRAASDTTSHWPWIWLVAFFFGKYLLMYGLAVDPLAAGVAESDDALPQGATRRSWLRSAYHFPANADVRVHLLALGLMSGQLTIELAVIALYYNFRWLARYALMARRPSIRYSGGLRT